MAKTETDPRAPIVNEWRGQPRYECPFAETCAFDTLDEQAMTAHLEPRHGKHPVSLQPTPQPPAPLPEDEREELVALREETTALRTENRTLKGKVTRLEKKVGESVGQEATENTPDDDTTTAPDAASEGAE